MKKTFLFLSVLFLAQVVVLSSCNKNEDDNDEFEVITITAGPTAAEEAQTAFIDANERTIIEFGEGTFMFTNTLSMDGKNDIIIRGAGRDLTTLDFSGQISGGEGVQISDCNNIRVENLTITDSEGDALKARDCNRISFVNVGTVWSGTPNENNGAYGLYPVLCTEVYIDQCYAYGASDAGIYVGQSDKVILKNSIAEANVAGIEIENTTNADVFDNEAFDNTGGILVFDLPGLTQYGKNVRVFNNNSYDNNRTNFAPAGNIVGNVPAGTGFMLLSTSDVELFNNSFTNNNVASVLIASYLIINDAPGDPNYNALPSNLYFHDNTYGLVDGAFNTEQPDLIQDIIDLLASKNLPLTDVLTDGIFFGQDVICIDETPAPSYTNLNAFIDDSFETILTDISVHNCTKTPLPEVSFTPY